MHLFAEQTKLLQTTDVADQSYFLAGLIEAQNEKNCTAVCEVCSNFNFSLSRQTILQKHPSWSSGLVCET